MKHDAIVIGIDDDFEESVILDLAGISMKCFASVCPYKIELGDSYPVEFYILTFDEREFEKVDKDVPDSIIWVDAFHYYITGNIKSGKIISSGIVFKDYDEFVDITYLEGERVKISADRLDVHFCD